MSGQDGTRIHTPITGQGFLRPPRLPITSQGHLKIHTHSLLNRHGISQSALNLLRHLLLAVPERLTLRCHAEPTRLDV